MIKEFERIKLSNKFCPNEKDKINLMKTKQEIQDYTSTLLKNELVR
jgi:hypothetical protein